MSFVGTLIVDGAITSDPSWDAVQQAVIALDGKEATEVTLAPPSPVGVPDGDEHMAIGGGDHDRCVVYVTRDNMRFSNLEDSSLKDGPSHFTMTIGGQEADFRRQQCVEKVVALRAAREYFEKGTLSADLHWVTK